MGLYSHVLREMVPTLLAPSLSGTIYDWASILSNWNNSQVVPGSVKRVLDVLHAATNPNAAQSPPLRQFLRYFNYPEETEGLYWCLYEAVSVRWMYGSIRMDYVSGLARLLNLDRPFPVFSGAPHTTQTVHQFLRENLTPDEFASLGLEVAPVTSAPVTSASVTSAPVTSAPVTRSPYPAAHIRVIRDVNDSSRDDRICIRKMTENTYDFVYIDPDGTVNCKMVGLRPGEVIRQLRFVLNFLVTDCMPFENVQVMLPGLPSIMLKTKSINSECRDTLYDAVETTMANWPVYV